MFSGRVWTLPIPAGGKLVELQSRPRGPLADLLSRPGFDGGLQTRISVL